MTGSLSSCATNPVTGTSDLALLSEDEETELGRTFTHTGYEVIQSLSRPKLLQYVTELGEKLAARKS